jgi:hypothetical protein
MKSTGKPANELSFYLHKKKKRDNRMKILDSRCFLDNKQSPNSLTSRLRGRNTKVLDLQSGVGFKHVLCGAKY